MALSRPMQRATLQACFLNVASSMLAQMLRNYHTLTKTLHYDLTPAFVAQLLTFDWRSIGQFVLYCLIATPPNFLWQHFLEETFPGYPPEPRTRKVKVDDDGRGVTIEQKLNLPNTLAKFAIDQTIGAAVNLVAFFLATTALRGGSWYQCLAVVQRDFIPVLLAGYKFWPLISLLNFFVVPVDRRVVVGSIAGLFWGIYLVLRTA